MAGVLRGFGFELFEWREVWGCFGCVGLVDGSGSDTEFTEAGRRERRFWRNSERSSWMSFHST